MNPLKMEHSQIVLKKLSMFQYINPKIRLKRTNQRPVSILPLLSKVYERLMFNQSSNHIKYFFYVKYYVVLERLIAPNMPFLDSYSRGKEN